jgi:hypothetical protein
MVWGSKHRECAKLIEIKEEKKEKNIQNNVLLFKQVIFCLESQFGFGERKDAPFKT